MGLSNPCQPISCGLPTFTLTERGEGTRSYQLSRLDGAARGRHRLTRGAQIRCSHVSGRHGTWPNSEPLRCSGRDMYTAQHAYLHGQTGEGWLFMEWLA